MSNKVIEANFSPKRNDMVLTCAHCECQQFLLVLEPLASDNEGQIIAECASCKSPQLVLKPQGEDNATL